MISKLKNPVFSVIIPTYNRPLQLARCLQAMVWSKYPRDQFEVIVVDDGGNRALEPVVGAFCEQIDVTLLTQPHAGQSQARNTAAAQAQGRYLAFTDDDCAPAPDWLSCLESYFEDAPGNAIGGRIVNALESNPYSAVSQSIIDYVYAYYNANPKRARFFSSNNIAMPTKSFHDVGGFDQSFRTAEDRDLCDRWLCHGYGMTFAPDAIVYHSHPLTLKGFFKQHFAYGRGAWHFYQTIRKRECGRSSIEIRFYLGLCNPLHYLKHERLRLKYTELVAVWQVANLAGFLWELWKQSSARPTAPLSLPQIGRV